MGMGSKRMKANAAQTTGHFYLSDQLYLLLAGNNRHGHVPEDQQGDSFLKKY